MPRRSAPRAFAPAPDATSVSPGAALDRERHDREIDDAFNKALLTRSESYGSFARRLPNAVPSDPARRPTPDAPSLPDLEPRDTNPTQLPGAAADAADAAAYARGRAAAAAAAASDADASDAIAARERRVEAFASALAAHLRDPSDDHFAALGLEDPTAAMVRDFRDALEMGDADADATANAAATANDTAATAGGVFEPLSPTKRNLPAVAYGSELARDRDGGDGSYSADAGSSSAVRLRASRPAPIVPPVPEPAVDEDGVEFEAIDQGETPFFLESPKMAKFDNFVDDEGASRDVSAATTDYEDDFETGENGEGEGGERAEGERSGDENAKDEREAEERRPILDGATKRAYGSAGGAAGTRPRMDGRIATPQKWDDDEEEEDEEEVEDEDGDSDSDDSDSDDPDSDDSDSDDSDFEEEPAGRASSGMLRRAKGRYVPSPTSSPARVSKPMATAAAAAAAAAESARPVLSTSASAFASVGSSSFKIKCGRCAAMLKLPAGVPLFRCPKCAAKLRVPAEFLESGAATADSNSKASGNAGSNPSAAAARTLWELREREAAIEAELAALAATRRAAETRRAAMEEIERHMAFSRSLEVVVEELSRRVARR